MLKIAEIRDLSARMQESRVLCEQVLERMEHVFNRFQAYKAEEATRTTPASVRVFDTALDRFKQMLAVFLSPQQSLLQRIAGHQSIVDEVTKAHVELDAILGLLGYDSTPEKWQRMMNEARDLQHQQLKQALEQTRLTTVDRDRIDEVLKMFRSATVVKRALQTLSPSDVEWMQSIYFKLFRLARSLPVDEPEWLLPLKDLLIDEFGDTIALGLCGTFFSGTWGRGTKVTILEMQFCSDTDQRLLMMNEANLWYKFNHPHVLKLFGAYHKEQLLFVCEDALDGHLGDFVSLPQNQHKVWRVLYEASLGIYFLHSQRIAHGDLRCRNIRIGVDNKAKLYNFYYSVKRDNVVHPEEKNALYSTTGVQWKAPEYFDGSLPTLASDIYSFGMTILEVVTGKTPWGANSDPLVHQFVSVGRLPMQPSELKNDAWRLVQRMCSFEPKERPSIITVVDELNAIMRHEAAQTATPTKNKFCTKCGNSMGATANFCNKCGTRVGPVPMQSVASVLQSARG